LRKDLVASAAAAHQEFGINFPSYFDNYFQCHYVFKGPDFFLMGREDPSRRDAWYVWWAECYPKRRPAEMLALFLRMMPHYRSEVGWWRPLKNGEGEVKYYSTDRLLRFMRAPGLTP
jgi:hypothetical protein